MAENAASAIIDEAEIMQGNCNVVCVEISHRHPYGSGGFWYRARRSVVCSFIVLSHNTPPRSVASCTDPKLEGCSGGGGEDRNKAGVEGFVYSLLELKG